MSVEAYFQDHANEQDKRKHKTLAAKKSWITKANRIYSFSVLSIISSVLFITYNWLGPVWILTTSLLTPDSYSMSGPWIEIAAGL